MNSTQVLKRRLIWPIIAGISAALIWFAAGYIGVFIGALGYVSGGGAIIALAGWSSLVVGAIVCWVAYQLRPLLVGGLLLVLPVISLFSFTTLHAIRDKQIADEAVPKMLHLINDRTPGAVPPDFVPVKARFYDTSGYIHFKTSREWRVVVEDLRGRLPHEWIETTIGPEQIAFASPLYGLNQDTVIVRGDEDRISFGIGVDVLAVRDPKLVRKIVGTRLSETEAHKYLRYVQDQQ